MQQGTGAASCLGFEASNRDHPDGAELCRVQCKTLNGTTDHYHSLAYLDWKPTNTTVLTAAEDAKVVVAVHGLTRNSRDFDQLARVLRSKGYRVICPDMPGRWLSDSLPDPSLYGYPQYVSDIRTLIHHLGLTKVDYIGTSMGGIIGMLSFSIPLAEGAHAFEIGKFVLNDVGPYLPKAALLRISSYVGDHKFKSWEELMQYAKGIFKTFGCQNEQQWNQVVQYYVNPIDEGEYKFRLHYDPAIAQAFKSVAPEALTDVNMWPQWTNVKCDSALVLRGASSDLLLRETVEEMQRTAKFPLQFREIEGVGHAPTLLTDDQIQIVCDFLAV